MLSYLWTWYSPLWPKLSLWGLRHGSYECYKSSALCQYFHCIKYIFLHFCKTLLFEHYLSQLFWMMWPVLTGWRNAERSWRTAISAERCQHASCLISLTGWEDWALSIDQTGQGRDGNQSNKGSHGWGLFSVKKCFWNNYCFFAKMISCWHQMIAPTHLTWPSFH